MQKLAPLTAIPLIENISFANANPIAQIFCQRKLLIANPLINHKSKIWDGKTKNQFHNL